VVGLWPWEHGPGSAERYGSDSAGLDAAEQWAAASGRAHACSHLAVLDQVDSSEVAAIAELEILAGGGL
jgi:hypothetical protein